MGLTLGKEVLIKRGKTLVIDVRWGVDPFVYKQITNISLQYGAPRLTVPGHGLKDRWAVAVVLVEGMVEINAQETPPGPSDFNKILFVDPDTVELNWMDPTGLSPYVGGGFIVFQTPQDLTGYTARMDIRDKIGGKLLASSRDEAGSLKVIQLESDPNEFRTRITISADNTAGFTFSKGVTELEMVSPSGVVSRLKLCSGKDEDVDPVRVVGEVTTDAA